VPSSATRAVSSIFWVISGFAGDWARAESDTALPRISASHLDFTEIPLRLQRQMKDTPKPMICSVMHKQK
jgi:hypothetical protein